MKSIYRLNIIYIIDNMIFSLFQILYKRISIIYIL